jgi:RHS repeat-associated protein
MPAAAKDEMLASANTEEIFSLAAGVAAALDTRECANAVRGRKPHQGIFSKNRRPRINPTWVKWSGTHQDRSLAWSETVLGPTVYLYDGQWENVIEEVDNSGNLLARYNQEMGLDFPLSEFRSSAASYYEQDGVNSVTSLSNSTGALANTYTYDAFGKLTASTGTLTNPFQYTAREFDSETGISEYRARYYDQSLGRFLSEDPVGFTNGTYNLYDYVSGDPVDFNDPSGNVKIHGNWCGPNWTGGQTEPYIPSHDVPGYYKDPRDYIDKVCSHHDKCYSKCRANHPCSPTGRRLCEKKCDIFLVGRTVANPLDIFNPWAYVVGIAVGVNPIPPAGKNGGAEPDNPVSCPCK